MQRIGAGDVTLQTMNVEAQPRGEESDRNVEIGGVAITLLRLLTSHSRFGQLIQDPSGSSGGLSGIAGGGNQTTLLAAVLAMPEHNAQVEFHCCSIWFCNERIMLDV